MLTGDYETCKGGVLSIAIETLQQFTFAVAEHARDNVTDKDLASLNKEISDLQPARFHLEKSLVMALTLSPPSEDSNGRPLVIRGCFA